jgi:hypothetical protein
LIPFLSDEMLDFGILFINDPLFTVNFLKQEPDFPLMLFFEAGSSFDMNVAVFLLNIFDFSFVHFFKFEDSLPERIIFSNKIFDFAFVSIFEVSVFLKL